MEWKDVKKLLKIADKGISEVIDTTETQLELTLATTALGAKKLEVIDTFIKENCFDKKILKAFDKYAETSLQLINDTNALIEEILVKGQDQDSV